MTQGLAVLVAWAQLLFLVALLVWIVLRKSPSEHGRSR
jgi:hypothetical protein